MIVPEFYSQRKLSGQVLTAYISQGTIFELFNSPDFQIHQAIQFSAQRASLIKVYSSSDV